MEDLTMNLNRWAAALIALSVIAIVFAYHSATDHNVVDHPTAGSPEDGAAAENTSLAHHGIDVSYHSGVVDWDSVAASGFQFAFVKATEGDDLKDPAFDSHWRALKQSGIVRGAYHFYVTEDPPETQAQFFIENVILDPGDLAPVVDIEVIGHNTPPGLTDRLTVFLSMLEAHYGIRPIIYTSPTFWNKYLSADFGHYPLWVAEYEVYEPRIPNGWTNWQMWQWKGDTKVAGVEKTADVSRVNHPRYGIDDFRVPSQRGSI
jgi:lysozyme